MKPRLKTIIISVIILAVLVLGMVAGRLSRDIPFAKVKPVWSIGMYTGQSPLQLNPALGTKNPVLTAKDVTDVKAEFVADPFLIKDDNTYYMFFEVMNSKNNQGDIGYATSTNGLEWTYQQIVLDEPFHLSYPYVFMYQGEYYLIPESADAYSIRLYKAIDFPTRWTFSGILLRGGFFDSSIFYNDGLWWLFTTDRNDVLRLYFADKLEGPYTEHPDSPIVIGNARIARPGGRITTFEGRIFRFTQDDYSTYGSAVRAFEITTLTTVNYEEKQVIDMLPLQATGNGWNASGIHNVDPYRISESEWIACVDGFRQERNFGWGN